MKYFKWIILLLAVLFLASCKKETPKELPTPPIQTQPKEQAPPVPVPQTNITPVNNTPVKLEEPKVSMVKDGPEEVRLGQNAAYTLTIANTGKVIAKDVVVRDKIPAGMRYNDVTDGMTLKWDLGDLAPDETRKITYTLGAIGTGIFTAQAELYIQDDFKYQLCFTTKVVAPGLKLKIEGARVCYLNKSVSYTITVTNDGDGSAKDINIVYNLPEGLEYMESNLRSAFKLKDEDKPATVIWRLDNIAPKSKIEFTLKLRGKNLGRVTNNVKLSSDTSEPPAITPLEASAVLLVSPVPEMKISQHDTEDQVKIGYQTTYVIETKNEGTSAFTNIILKSKIPPEMEFVKADGPSSYKFDSSTDEVIFEAVNILAVGDKLVSKITCKAVSAGLAKHIVTITYDQFRSSIIDEEETTCYE